MAYRLFITPRAQREIQEFVEHLRAYSEDFAEEQLARLSLEVSTYVLETPFLWNYSSLPATRTTAIFFVSVNDITIGLFTQ